MYSFYKMMINNIEVVPPVSGRLHQKEKGGARRLMPLRGLIHLICSIAGVPSVRNKNRKANATVRSSGTEEVIKEER